MRCIWLLCLSLSLFAQTVDVSNLGTGTVSLAGQWKFHPGDNSQWADPNFDDSGWKLVKVPLSLNEQGYPKFSGYGWYRLTLYGNKESSAPDLTLKSSFINNVGEIFANGTSIGRFGRFPPHPQVYSSAYTSRPSQVYSSALTSYPLAFGVPGSRWSRGGRLVLAVRIWVDPRFTAAGQSGLVDEKPSIGLPPLIRAEFGARQYRIWSQRLLLIIQVCAELLLSLYLIVLCFSRNRRPEYYWFAFCFCIRAGYTVFDWIGTDTSLITFPHWLYTLQLLQPLTYTSLLLGIWSVYQARVSRPVRLFLAAFGLAPIFDIFVTETGHWELLRLANRQSNPLVILDVTCHFIILVFLWRRVRNGSVDARWLALSEGSFALFQLTSCATKIVALFQPTIAPQALLPWRDISFLNIVLGVGYLLMRRFGHAQVESERLHTEMKAAHEIQSLLLPARFIPTPGFKVEATYLPAQEVGGDFFQLTTASDGSLLVAIGDVSGKGLQAALTVSLVIGLWKEITASILSPAEILLRLNRQLESSVKGGFVTCLCARLASDGRLTIANAGHLAPYLNGTELTTLNELPLGITTQSEYEESHYLLSLSDTLVFVSDGVVEARDKNQSFFGFERLQQVLSEHPGADAIARRAQQFGQEDDITVISVTRQAVAVEPVVQTQAVSIAV